MSAETNEAASATPTNLDGGAEARRANGGRPLRVAMDVQALRTARTGVATYVEQLAAQFAADDTPCTVTPVRGPARLPNTNKLFRIVNQVIHLVWLNLWLPLRLVTGRYDVLFSPEYLTPIWVPVARVVTYHDSAFVTRPQDYNHLWLLYYRRVILPAIRRADAIIVPSRHAAREAVTFAHLPAERLHVVPLGGPTSSESMRVSEAIAAATLATYHLADRGYILHVGVLERRKNLVMLVRAFAQWRADAHMPDVKLVLVGQPGPRPDLDDSSQIRDVIKDLGLEHVVVLTGHVSLAERNALYTHAAVVAIPSVLEGFGIPVLEAFASCVPLVVSTACSLPEVAGDAALLFDPSSAAQLVSALSRAMSDVDVRMRLIHAGSARLRLFTWHAAARATCAVFRAAAAHATASSPTPRR